MKLTVAAMLLLCSMVLTACQPTTLGVTRVTAAPNGPLPDTVPALPFADNPDPTQCGIPQQVALRGVAHGEVDGEPVAPIVYLYESHLRQRVVGQIFPGTSVEILLSQSNPTLDYYFVKSINVEPAQEGWIPAPYVDVQS